MINSVSALSGLVGRVTSPEGAGSATSSAGAAGAGSDFASVLQDMSAEAVSTLEKGEAAAISGIGGTSSPQEVVQAVMSAEQTLQAALAIRDKVVSAYQELSRMQI